MATRPFAERGSWEVAPQQTTDEQTLQRAASRIAPRWQSSGFGRHRARAFSVRSGTSNLALPSRASRLAFDMDRRGIAAPSAEHGGSGTRAIFETASVSGKRRVDLVRVERLDAIEF
jgi:hypothetical protein